jgi:hypothetical protein
MVEPVYEEAADKCDEDRSSFARTNLHSDDYGDEGNTCTEPVAIDDERYSHINPALLERLRAKRLREGQQLRRSA